ncbi:hypothetical protein ACK3SF_04210 [Candidatus Nanosalina sp. VS9-1]|uniref:hypothetical protein n=1 Tax=Candidatus Nanosalina sp. VS9-1 TaxID=3388566 RepID=UPI0039E00D69
MRWNDVPDTYSKALEEGFSTFETEYRGIGGWAKVRSLFEGALDEKAEALGLDYDAEVGTGEILLSERENGLEGYVAVLYKESYDARRPVAKGPLMRLENFRHEYTGSHKPDEIGIPGDPDIVDVDGANLRHSMK